MIERFLGDQNRDKRIAAIQKQRIVQGNFEVATKLETLAEILEYTFEATKNTIIRQNHSDNEIYFILAGKVSVVVNGREVAVRSAGDHVGEMSMIDDAAPRSATVLALETTVLAKIGERDFTHIANEYPTLWRQIALVLGERLRERGKLIRVPNPRPVVFIGSSTENRHIAFEIRDGLSRESCLPKVWSDDLFKPSSTAIETLEHELAMADFAIMLVTPDDLTRSRKTQKLSPRDNVVWEHGFFTGGLTRQRVFIAKPLKVDLKMPSDLGAVTSLEYDPVGTTDDLRARLGPVINGVRKEIERLKQR